MKGAFSYGNTVGGWAGNENVVSNRKVRKQV